MRKLLIPIVASASVLTVAAPLSAQTWTPPANSYQHDTYQHDNYQRDRYNYRSNELNFPRAMQARVERIRGEIRSMQERRILSWREARSLENEAARIQDRIWRDSRNGIQPGEARRIEERINRLEYRVSREANDLNTRPDYRRY
jgi:predicted RNase H-like nuclease (RuvC/YqgF family)